MRTSYHDIKADVLDRIRKNIWPPGANLPGEIELAEEFGCARATVNRAMRELVSEGILERKRKAGTRVKSSPSRKAKFSIPLIREEITNTGATYRYVLVDRNIIAAPGWLRAQIEIPKGQKVLHLRCMHYAGNRPYQFEERWINLGAVPDAEGFDFKDMGPNDWLVRKVPFTNGELVFSATNATLEIADFLNIAEGDAIFTVERTTWLEDISVTYARLYFARDYKMTTQL
ncbi:UTRA domain-containing protein [uncultured Roseobacter sp.]|uniref:UTRA domain-containing protein n=1 Tax=uncultured Roseobacter sp. TaxID=114847 RepID=UPI002627EC1C|nr:UTRA domain-containing protein [uncultured Roseobacter sp.]